MANFPHKAGLLPAASAEDQSPNTTGGSIPSPAGLGNVDGNHGIPDADPIYHFLSTALFVVVGFYFILGHTTELDCPR